MIIINVLLDYLIRIRVLLAGKQALFALSLLGLLTGILAGGVIILFRFSIEYTQTFFLPGADPENYEGLSWQVRILITSAGGLILGVLYYFYSKIPLRVGVIHVLERLAYNEGNLPLKNMILQFFGATIAIVSGHSVGREGPSVHLGAGTASLLGQYLHLPNNSIRTLVGCGAAAAIAASFNTPLAGVIFAMEVILMEYTITGFTPIILSAVSATAVCRMVFDTEPIFVVQAVDLESFFELPIIVLMGIFIGTIAALLIRLTRIMTIQGAKISIGLRLFLAGAGVGLIALISPEVMGIGYDTVNAVMLGQIGIFAIVVILLAKVVATSLCVGFSIPAGLIGPAIFIGGLAGGIVGKCVEMYSSNFSDIGLYVMLGMGAMMGATLQAPLAALLALLEMTGNQNIIFPGMLAIVSANLAARELFKSDSFFLTQFKGFGLDYRNDPVAQSLRRIGVESVMNKAYIMTEPVISRTVANTHLKESPDWLLIRRDDSNQLMPATDLARHLKETDDDEVDLLEIPAKRRQLVSVSLESTLQHAQQLLNDSEAEALYVIRKLGVSADRIYGILTQEDIEKHYRSTSH
ncbi:MAG: chloride channel protein [Proteobacteria bacterium]|nr:chloride channel protein [Pseudomonadota bacterium]